MTVNPTIALQTLPTSGWASWAPEISEAEALEPAPETANAFWLGGVLTLLMWGFASVLAVWYW